ncbi:MULTISPECIES: hypothetical protein [unclassified Streptomyces]|uniref:hypothetical protein n=1 Tax=unclassified Streptomyces TaxID=2593676 RepID=UPI003806783E
MSPQCLVSFKGNLNSVPPGLTGAQVRALHRLGEDHHHRHRRPGGDRPPSSGVSRSRSDGQTVREAGHVIALEREVLAAFSDRARCRNKVRRPPSEAALAEAKCPRGQQQAAGDPAERVVIDLSHYAAVADLLRSVPSPREKSKE